MTAGAKLCNVDELRSERLFGESDTVPEWFIGLSRMAEEGSDSDAPSWRRLCRGSDWRSLSSRAARTLRRPMSTSKSSAELVSGCQPFVGDSFEC